MQATTPRQQIGRVLTITLVLNLTVAIGKIIVGMISGALSITADGFHSLIDSTSNVIALIANRLADRPPDDDHPYGHQRFETLAALMIGAFLLVVAWEIVSGAISRLQSGAQPELTIMTFVVLIGTLFVNIGVSSYQIREGRRLKSELLLADAANTRADVFITSSVLVSMALMTLFDWAWVDIVAALIVVVLIGHAAWRILQQTGRVLVDTAPYTPEELTSIVDSVPYVVDVVRARSRGSVDAPHIDIDVSVSAAMTTDHTAAITERIRQQLNDELGHVDEVEVHFIPDNRGDDDYALTVRALADELGVSTHEVIVIDADKDKMLEMHVEVPPNLTLHKAHELVSKLEWNIHNRLPEISDVMTHIEPAHQVDEGLVANELSCEEIEKIKRQAIDVLRVQYPDVNWHDLRVYNYGDCLSLSMHAAFEGLLTVEAAHETAEAAETLLRTKMPHISRVTIHTEPFDHR